MTVTCPRCHELSASGARFCECCGCGLTTVRLHLSGCRPFYERMVGEDDPPFPDEPPTGSFELTGDQVTVGRRRGQDGETTAAGVDIALTDPGISQSHCTFVREETAWAVQDADSTNGTWVDEADRFRRLDPGERWTLSHGDRIFLGGWTCLTVEVAAG